MTDEKRTKNRSPVHPLVGLSEAIEVADKLADSSGFAFAPVSVVLKALDFSEKSSGGLRTIAALIHFGLAENVGSGKDRKVRLTDLARRILQKRKEGGVDLARQQEAALSPTIYRKLWEEWFRDGDTPSLGTMEWELRHTHEFNPASIAGFIKDFLATMAFAGLDKRGSGANIGGNVGGAVKGSPTTAKSGAMGAEPKEKSVTAPAPEKPREPAMINQQVETPTQIENLTIPLHRGAMAVLSIPWPLSTENFEALEKWLEYVRGLTRPSGSTSGN